ncbi:hypothetical protein NMY22_g2791 [Coprinellus aureogranulatus]|nr:hypothetical protein NMY22_g2791 [Coprinellus aureogranulatus]
MDNGRLFNKEDWDKLPPGLQRTHRYTAYLHWAVKRLNGVKTSRKHENAHVRTDISFQTQAMLETMALKIDQAWKNPVQLDFSLEEVSLALQSAPKGVTRDEYLRKRFCGPYPPNANGDLHLVDKPCVYLDKDQKVSGWYIPGLFSSELSEQVFEAVQAATIEPGSIFTVSKSGASLNSWRNKEESFANPQKCVIPPGNANISVGWYPLGQGGDHTRLTPSTAAKSVAGLEFVERLEEVNALIGALLGVIQPGVFQRQMEVLQELYHVRGELAHCEAIEALFQSWSTPFNAFAVIANRETVFHRDNKGGIMLPDILSVFGRYRQGRLEVPLLGARFVYNPGASILLPGYLLEHGASKTNGERICLASFIRPQVGESLVQGYDVGDLGPPDTELLAKRNQWPTPTFAKNIWE